MAALRIIAGEFKGRKIRAPKSRSVRPTSDRVRESIFALVGDIHGLRVLDLYAGSGALGIEALSRGATEATFVDNAAGLPIEMNLDQLGLADNGVVFRQRCERFLGAAAKKRARWDLVFIDPPYKLADRLVDRLDRLVPPVLEEGAQVVVESSAKKPLSLALPEQTSRIYGSTHVSVYRLDKK